MEKTKITFKSNNENLIWKYPIEEIDENVVIICPPTHEVIFIKDGVLEEIYNQGSHYPIKKPGLFKKSEKVSCEIIYVNKSIECNINWGTPSRLDVLDPFTKMLVKYGACGKYTIAIENTRRLYEKILSSNNTLTIDSIKEYFMDSLIYIVKTEMSNMIREYNVGFNEVYSYLEEVALRITNKIQPEFQRAGLKMLGLTFTNIIIDEDILEKFKNKEFVSESKDMYCPKCGNKIGLEHKFCPTCGHNLSNIKRCTECNNAVFEDDLYCMHCGKKL